MKNELKRVNRKETKEAKKRSCSTFCNCSEFCMTWYWLSFYAAAAVVSGCHLVAGALIRCPLCVICPANRKQNAQSQFFIHAKWKRELSVQMTWPAYTPINKPSKISQKRTTTKTDRNFFFFRLTKQNFRCFYFSSTIFHKTQFILYLRSAGYQITLLVLCFSSFYID